VTAGAFAELHPAVQYHVVNTLGWTGLRPLQQESIRPVLRGDGALLIAPTAGGKTEAAMLPLLSRMSAGNWRGLSVVYVCPLRALLNNLEPRLSLMAGWLGRRVGLWHGDIAESVKRRLAADPPDVLLTTPESLEAMLISGRVDHSWAFGTLQAVVVDELHAFAGDDRGWHLLGVLARLTRVAGHQLQRIGLSATVGNPEALLDWLCDDPAAPRTVVSPLTGQAPPPEIQLDHAGSLANAAIVIARLYQGSKRLVFCDSRAQTEQLAVALRGHGVQTYVSHSSLSADTRRQTEAAFATAANCVIVATSTLELGVDIGDLDHVIQVDAPDTVASFLQRLGRTGRRPGTVRNALFLTTRPETLWKATALMLLWQRGYVEPVTPPALPSHIVAQQLLGLALQERRLVRTEILTWLGGLAAVPSAGRVLSFLVDEEFLIDDGGLISIGPRAEKEYGGRFFRDLTSSFTSEPTLTAIWGREILGELPALALAARPAGGPHVVLLGGRSWTVRHVDWRTRRVQVEPSDIKGSTRWISGGRATSHVLARAHHDVLAGHDPAVRLSRRAQAGLVELRAKYDFVEQGSGFSTYLVRQEPEAPAWWTFAGFAANRALAAGLTDLVESAASGLYITARPETSRDSLRNAVRDRCDQVAEAAPALDEEAIDSLKFSVAIPKELAEQTVRSRLTDREAVLSTMDSSLRGAVT
jgi:ATP-dependent helicase Lhr and Lhr-like helicase